MSTRSNVVIKKQNEENVILYHHHDGYPSGVGKGLTKYFNEIYKSEKKNDILSTAKSLGDFLVNDCDDEYEYTECLHGDIEYIYVIDLDSDSVTCISVWRYDEKYSDDEMIDGTFTPDEDNYYIYNASIWDGWEEIEIKLNEE